MISSFNRFVEFLVLFIIVPILLAIPNLYLELKVSAVLVALIYLVYVGIKQVGFRFKRKLKLPWSIFLKRIMPIFVVIAICTTLYVWQIKPEALFCVPKSNLALFVMILLVYSLLSVWPQEIIFRTFFFERYKLLFKSQKLLIFTNAFVFMLAHLFFKNTLVLVLTFIGGLLFAFTYCRTKSTLLVSIEHAVYGNWLFTVGMGEMLAFPGMESCG